MKKWRTYQVDDELEDSWLESLNTPKNLKLASVCTGHDDSKNNLNYPHATYYSNFKVDEKTWLIIDRHLTELLPDVSKDGISLFFDMLYCHPDHEELYKDEIWPNAVWVAFRTKQKWDLSEFFGYCTDTIMEIDALLGILKPSLSLPITHNTC